MTWQDRIQQAAYTQATSNTRVTFAFEDVSRDTPLRNAGFDFANVNDSYVQENGYSARRYPMRCYFTGETHDLEATAFEAELLRPGGGVLEHPLYGTFTVVPFGTISRRNEMVRQANQSVVSVTFWTTTGVVYPSATVSPQNEILARIAGFNVEAAQELDRGLLVKFKSQQARLRGTVEANLAAVQETLAKPAQALVEIDREFRAWQQTINSGLNTLVGQPLALAQQMISLVTLPARAAIGIQNRILSYAAFTRSIFGSPAGKPWENPSTDTVNTRRRNKTVNDWYFSDFMAATSLASMALAATETEYRTKPEAVATADALLAELDAFTAWRDQGYATLSQSGFGAGVQNIDRGQTYAAVYNTVTRAAGYLVQLSFTLSPERSMVLGRPRTIIDLAAELYGSVDDRLDFLIDTNRITGAEMLEVPRGRTIVWYP